VFKPLLYELLNSTAGEGEVAPRYDQLLAPYPINFVQVGQHGVVAQVPRVRWLGWWQSCRDNAGAASTPSAPSRAPPSLQAKVQEVQLRQDGAAGSAAGAVVLADGQTLEYDWLVVALGAEADPRGVPGVRELAVPFQSYDDAMRVGGKTWPASCRAAAGAFAFPPPPPPPPPPTPHPPRRLRTWQQQRQWHQPRRGSSCNGSPPPPPPAPLVPPQNLQVKAKLDELASGGTRGTIVIVGAGYSGERAQATWPRCCWCCWCCPPKAGPGPAFTAAGWKAALSQPGRALACRRTLGRRALPLPARRCAGVELASVMAERMRGCADIRLVTPGADILEQAPTGQRQAAARALAADGVQVMTGVKVGGAWLALRCFGRQAGRCKHAGSW
jgi:hypothetical protein